MARPKQTGAHTILCELFGTPKGTKVIDAVQDMDITVTKQDVRRATPKDPTNCGYARAICRQTGAAKAEVYRGSTYLLTERDGAPVILRYQTNDDMRVILSRFDLNKRMAEHTIKLRAPKGTQTLKELRKRNVRYREAIKNGEHVPEPRGPQDKRVIASLRPTLMSMPH